MIKTLTISRRHSTMPFRLPLFRFLVMLAVAAFVTGCARNNNPPAQDAPPQDVAQYLTGEWTATLNPDLVEQGVAPLNVPMTLSAGALEDGSATLSGSIAGAEISEASVSTAEGQPGLQFSTGSITAQGEAGEIAVQGPLNWSALLRDGVLYGQVVGADGRSNRWTARKN